MGLDMYLSKKHYVQNWDFMKPSERHKITIKLGGKIHPTINPEKITYITESVGYWRKANAIHQWFVDNVQEGRDECQESYVTKEQLQTLLETCKKVKEASVLVNETEIKDASVAKELLPSQSGFFFGGTEYDQYYLDDINQTIEILETELDIKYPKSIYEPEYFYRASW